MTFARLSSSVFNEKKTKKKSSLILTKRRMHSNILTSTSRKDMNRKLKTKNKPASNTLNVSNKKTIKGKRAETHPYTKKLSRLATLQRSKLHKVPHLFPMPSSQSKDVSMRVLSTLLKSTYENIQNKSFSKEMLSNVCTLATGTLNLNVFQSLRREQKINLSNNLKYMRDIIGTPSTGTNFLQQQSTPETNFFQRQGCSALCGLCALNNLVGKFEFQSIDLDSIADEIWFQQINDGQSLVDEIQSTRSRDGYYCIEVLLLAANKKGMDLQSINPNSDLMSVSMAGSATSPVKFLMGTSDEHFVAIHTYNDHTIVFDSLLAKPMMITTEQFITYVQSRCTLIFKLAQAVYTDANDSSALHHDLELLTSSNCKAPWYITDSVRLKVHASNIIFIACL